MPEKQNDVGKQICFSRYRRYIVPIGQNGIKKNEVPEFNWLCELIAQRSILIIILAITLITGCAKTALVKLDSALISEDTATLIIYSDESYNQHFIFMDDKGIGLAHREIPFKGEVPVGKHILYRRDFNHFDSLTLGLTSKKTEVNFEAGKVYFMKVELKSYIFHHTFQIIPTNPVLNFQPR